MLGLDHYCGSISKIDAYIKGKYKYKINKNKQSVISIVDKLKNNCFDNVSWVELFFNSNVHILGLSLDFSETDLWWVLNKRARLMLSHNINNKIYFYDSNISDDKKSLLKSMNVIVVEREREGNDYLSAHNLLMTDLKNNLTSSKLIAA